MNSDLSLVPTDDLLREVAGRFDCFVYAATQIRSNEEAIHDASMMGDPHIVIGNVAKLSIMADNYLKRQLIQGRLSDIAGEDEDEGGDD